MFPKTNLPIEEVIPEIVDTLDKNLNLVIEAPPGAGKTTIVPLSLMNSLWLTGKRIIMLEPRRLAARAVASRMAELLNETVGETVGYRTRLDSRVCAGTRIEVVTEGILTKMIQSDPSLGGIGAVIFDEFHERSIHADVGLAFCLESQTVLRDDMRILAMSATLDGQEVSSIMGDAPIIKSLGKSFPVETRYLDKSISPGFGESASGPSFISMIASAITKAVREEEGSILVFLPGAGEIRRVESLLRGSNVAAALDIVPLYGDLSKEQQDLAIKPSAGGRRKVVLATSIAETSLTIEGIRIVIDSGLMRVSRFSPSTGMSRLETLRVTRASADQRRGRAGRLGPGLCLRLWTEVEDKGLKEQNTPEIMEADLTPLALDLAVWGAKESSELRWLDNPPAAAMFHARDILARLEAIDGEGKATSRGKEMAGLGIHPRLAHMVLKGKEIGLGSLACGLAAILTERDFIKSYGGMQDSDLRTRLDVLAEGKKGWRGDADPSAIERIKKGAELLRKRMDVRKDMPDADKAGLLLAFAYPDRVAKRRMGSEGRYLLSNGRGGYFVKPEPLSSEEYIVIAALEEGERASRIFLAAPISEDQITRYMPEGITETESVVWDRKIRDVVARRQKRLCDLVMNESPVTNPKQELVIEAFINGIRQEGLGLLPWDKAAVNLRGRVNFLRGIGENFPDLSDEWLLNNLGKWLAPWLGGIYRLDQLSSLKLRDVVASLLSREQQTALERLAPAHITVPTGTRITIDYSAPNKPVLAVRIQEMFGLDKHPAIAGGKTPLTLHLLSPAGRPIQVTSDLPGFWAGSYALVKKEMKGRYPKHSWPDDPLQAEPTNKAKRKIRDMP